MTLEQLVPTLETCKRLKSAGFPQDTYAVWVPSATHVDDEYVLHIDTWKAIPSAEVWFLGHSKFYLSAPTAAEIGKWLPDGTFAYEADDGDTYECAASIQRLHSGLWQVSIYEADEGMEMWFACNHNLAEVLSVTLLCLRKQVGDAMFSEPQPASAQ